MLFAVIIGLHGGRDIEMGLPGQTSESTSCSPSASRHCFRQDVHVAGNPAPSGRDFASRMEPGRPTPQSTARRLPLQATRLIGRAVEVDKLRSLLLRPDLRLLTLIGPPGAGKSRLGQAAASVVVDEFAGGVYVVDLSALADPMLVPIWIGRVLGIHEAETDSILERLEQVLRAHRVLLVLDNFEHLLPAADTLGRLLAAGPELSVLATSRVPLHVSWERLFPVPPLRLPSLDPVPDPGALLEVEAVALFVERARALNPGFELHARNARAVAEICVRLDGLPLAIELAAAQARLLTPAALLDRLGDGLGVLASAGRDQPDRHRTLLAAIDQSYIALDPVARIVLRGLALFRGGFTLEGASRVADIETGNYRVGLTTEDVAPYAIRGEVGRECLDALGRLVDQNLIQVFETADGQPRYRLLEPVREYALERLKSSRELAATARRHAAHFVDLAERAEPNLCGPEQATWFERLEVEHDNLRVALDWATRAREDEEIGLRLVNALWWFWLGQGHLTEGRAWLDATLALPSSTSVASIRCRVLRGAARLAIQQQDYDAAEARLGESVAIARSADDPRDLAASLNTQGRLAYEQGNYSSAQALAQESLVIALDAGDDGESATARRVLGLVAYDRGDYRAAQESLEACLMYTRERGDARQVAEILNNLGSVACDHGDYRRARWCFDEALTIWQSVATNRGAVANTLKNLGALARAEGRFAEATAGFAEALAIWRELGDRRGTALCLDSLGSVALEQGDVDAARQLFEEGHVLRHHARNRQGLAVSLRNLGRIALEQGRLKEAEERFVQSLEIDWAAGRRGGLLPELEAMSIVAAVAGQVERALVLAGAASAWRRALEIPALPADRAWFERYLPAAHQALPPERASGLQSFGEALSLDNAVALARDPNAAPSVRAPTSSRGPLSRREREVAALIAQGLSNREIAARLTITEGTVASHVVHILTKLDLRSRTQIARWILDKRASSPPPL